MAERREHTEPLLSGAMAQQNDDWGMPEILDPISWLREASAKMVQGYRDIWNAITDVTGRIATVNNWVQGIQTQGNTNTARIRDLERVKQSEQKVTAMEQYCAVVSHLFKDEQKSIQKLEVNPESEQQRARHCKSIAEDCICSSAFYGTGCSSV